MSLLDQIQKPTTRAVQATLVGEAGVGKTTLAASFPSPVFIRTEDGLESLGANSPMAFPVANSSDEVLAQLNALGEGQHPYKTVIIDIVAL